MSANLLTNLRMQLERELKSNILKFWMDNACDNENGGFYGFISNERAIASEHEKASVLNFRILWTFSAAYRLYGDAMYLEMAKYAFGYIKEHFIDYEYSGVHWLLDYKGCPSNAKKQVYAIAFGIYGLSEYYRATGDDKALALAINLYESIEAHARERQHEGYLEALAQDWSPLSDMSLSPKDMNAAKSMNTHLHILEAYTNLLRVWNSPELKSNLKQLLEVVLDHIVAPETWSFNLFFDISWTSLADITSYGHDIEGSWLIYEAAEALGDETLLKKAGSTALRMAEHVLKNGVDPVYGGIYNEKHNGRLDDSKDWWPQAEAVVGFFNAWQLTGSGSYLEASMNIWDFHSKAYH